MYKQHEHYINGRSNKSLAKMVQVFLHLVKCCLSFGLSIQLSRRHQLRSPCLVSHVGKVGVAGERYTVAMKEVFDGEAVCKPGDLD